MQRIRKAIQAFWLGKLGRDEQKTLLDDLQSHGKTLKKVLGEEFLHGKRLETHKLSETQSRKILLAVHERLELNGAAPPKARVGMLRWVGAAAALLCAVTGYWSLTNPDGVSVATASRKPDTFQLANTGNDTVYYRFRDGSKVKLYPKSTIDYTSTFGVGNRALNLVGGALFSVANDANLPFSVSANGYITTALGTSFAVDTRPKGGVRVQLLSGKVVVSAAPDNPFGMADTELAVGEELLADGEQRQFSVRRFVPERVARPVSAKRVPPPVDERKAVDSLVFDQTPLASVFDAISKRWNVIIDTQGTDLGDLSFTGSFAETDALDIILTVICRMNDLQYTWSADRKMIMINK